MPVQIHLVQAIAILVLSYPATHVAQQVVYRKARSRTPSGRSVLMPCTTRLK